MDTKAQDKKLIIHILPMKKNVFKFSFPKNTYNFHPHSGINKTSGNSCQGIFLFPTNCPWNGLEASCYHQFFRRHRQICPKTQE